MTDEGTIKFHGDWHRGDPIPPDCYALINPWRQRLYDHGLIGVTPDGIGYGNLSVRYGPENQFVITGTATGGFAALEAPHYTRVVSYDLKKNTLSCNGPIHASSESLTHAALYQTDPAITAVAHVHSAALWQRLLHHAPTTSADVPYGTPQMALEMKRLYRETDLPQTRLLVMAGHRDGVVSFGENLREAIERLEQCIC